METIIDGIKNISQRNETVLPDKLLLKNAQTIPFSAENVHPIQEPLGHVKIGFVDGGNAEIIAGGDFSVQFIRAYGCIFKGKKRIYSTTHECYVLATSVVSEGEVMYAAELYPVKGNQLVENFLLPITDASIKEGIANGNITKIGEMVRKFAEIALATSLTEQLSTGDIIVMDGSLQSLYTNQSAYLDAFYDAGEKRNVIITALSKTSRLFTTQGKNAVNVLKKLGHRDPWYYYPSAIINDAQYKAQLYFLKLHAASSHVFKFDVHGNHPIEVIASQLAYHSADPVFPGYPYGLIVADQFGRVSNAEKEYLRTMLRTKVGQRDDGENAVNAHGILDRIR